MKKILFQSTPLLINAPLETVWNCVKKIERYHEFSQGMITVHVAGELVADNNIFLTLTKKLPLGKLAIKSTEKIILVDDQNKIIGWSRKIPGGMTERYHSLRLADDGKNTLSHITLQIPGWVGIMTRLTMGKLIETGFEKLNAGIKIAAEKNV